MTQNDTKLKTHLNVNQNALNQYDKVYAAA